MFCRHVYACLQSSNGGRNSAAARRVPLPGQKMRLCPALHIARSLQIT